MKKKKQLSKPKVFFNASVILAGLHSPSGGSGKILRWSKNGKIIGLTSEIALDEAKKHANKINQTPVSIEIKTLSFLKITTAPPNLNNTYTKFVIDIGDIHLFTSSQLEKVDYLVSLDKKHVLALANKFKQFKIVSPAQLISKLS